MSIEWTRANNLPDADINVIVAMADGEVCAGFYDGHDWRWIDAQRITIPVTH